MTSAARLAKKGVWVNAESTATLTGPIKHWIGSPRGHGAFRAATVGSIEGRDLFHSASRDRARLSAQVSGQHWLSKRVIGQCDTLWRVDWGQRNDPAHFLHFKRKESAENIDSGVTYQESGKLNAVQAQSPARYSEGSLADLVGN